MTDCALSLDDADVSSSHSNNPAFTLNHVSIPYKIWQNMKLLKDTYDMSKELMLEGYRDKTMLEPAVIRQLLQLHEVFLATPYIKLKRPLRDAKLANLLPRRLVVDLQTLFRKDRKLFWNVYAATHILCDEYMFEYISAFLATICRDTDPARAADISRQLMSI